MYVQLHTFTTQVMPFLKAIQPDNDISDHHCYDNCTVHYSYYYPYYNSIVVTITTVYCGHWTDCMGMLYITGSTLRSVLILTCYWAGWTWTSSNISMR